MEALSLLGSVVKLAMDAWDTFSEKQKAEIEATAQRHLKELTDAREGTLRHISEGDKQIDEAFAKAREEDTKP